MWNSEIGTTLWVRLISFLCTFPFSFPFLLSPVLSCLVLSFPFPFLFSFLPPFLTHLFLFLLLFFCLCLFLLMMELVMNCEWATESSFASYRDLSFRSQIDKLSSWKESYLLFRSFFLSSHEWAVFCFLGFLKFDLNFSSMKQQEKKKRERQCSLIAPWDHAWSSITKWWYFFLTLFQSSSLFQHHLVNVQIISRWHVLNWVACCFCICLVGDPTFCIYAYYPASFLSFISL